MSIPPCQLIEKDGQPDWCSSGCERFHHGHYRDYALDPGEKGQKFRQYWRDIKSGKKPSIVQQAFNYSVSLIRHIADGAEKASPEEIEYRKSKCGACKHNRDNTCMLCGCPLVGTAIGDKLAWRSSSCWNWEKYGVAIGCYNLPKLAELQIQLIGHMCGPTPILICDDTPPDTERQKAHAQLALKYPHVTYWPNSECYGHHRGDASVFWKAIQWGKQNSLDAVVKLSMRHLINIKGWLKDSMNPFMASGEATGAVNCIDNDTRLFIRSEAVLLRIDKWFNSGAWQELQGRNSYAPVVELHYNHLMCKYFGEMDWTDEKGFAKIGRRWVWPLLQERRHNRIDGILWHCANGEEEYRLLGRKYGIELEPDFHTGGSEKRIGFAKGYKIG